MTLNKDFFDYYKIKVLRGMPNGDNAVLLYIFLLLESLNWNGELRYDEKTAYTVDTLRNLYSTKQKPSSFRGMFSTLKNINLILIKDDGTIVVDTTPITIGKDTESAKYYRQRRFANANPTQTQRKPSANPTQTYNERLI